LSGGDGAGGRPSEGGARVREAHADSRSASEHGRRTYSRPAPPRPTSDELADRIRAVGDPAVVASLTDGTVGLRTWTTADAPAIVSGLQDGSAAYWIVGMPHPYGPEEAADFLARAERELATAAYAHLAITDAASGRVLGAVGMHFRHDRQTGEIGYWVSPDERGRGIAARAVALVTRWGLEVLQLPRLELIIHPLNCESQMIASRNGFRREGLLRSYLEHRGARNDYYCFSRLPDDPDPAPQPVLRATTAARDDRDGEELVLRPWRLRDAEAAVDLIAGDPEILRCCVDIDEEIDLAREREFIAEGARQWCEHGLPRFAILVPEPDSTSVLSDPDGSESDAGADRDRVCDRVIGSIGFEPPERPGVGELGYLVAAEGRDRGVATAALSAATSWALGEGGLEACELLIDPGNERSVKAAENAGYSRVGEAVLPRRGMGLSGMFGLWRRTAAT